MDVLAGGSSLGSSCVESLTSNTCIRWLIMRCRSRSSLGAVVDSSTCSCSASGTQTRSVLTASWSRAVSSPWRGHLGLCWYFISSRSTCIGTVLYYFNRRYSLQAWTSSGDEPCLGDEVEGTAPCGPDYAETRRVLQGNLKKFDFVIDLCIANQSALVHEGGQALLMDIELEGGRRKSGLHDVTDLRSRRSRGNIKIDLWNRTRLVSTFPQIEDY